jgi:hypothetical protein
MYERSDNTVDLFSLDPTRGSRKRGVFTKEFTNLKDASKPEKMEYIQKLDSVEKDIKDLLDKETKLAKKEQTGAITDEEAIDLEGIGKLFKELYSQQKYWQELIKLATKEDTTEPEAKSFREADRPWIESVCDVNCQYRKWTTYVLDNTVQPSQRFKQNFIETMGVFHQTCEAGRRIFLNIFLSDIIGSSEFIKTLRIFTEVPMDVLSTSVAANGKKRKLNGKTDYTIGFGRNSDVFDITSPNELYLVAIEAKCRLDESDLWQCVAETATLYKSRKDMEKKKCAVWGVLSNAETWQFIHLDEAGKLWRSEKFLLNLREYQDEQVLVIYRMLYYMIKCCFESSPQSSPNLSTSELVV